MPESSALPPIVLVLLVALAVAAAYAAYEWRRAADARGAAERDLAAAKAKLEQVDVYRAERDAAVAARDHALADAARLAAELAAEKGGSDARAIAAREREEALMAMKAEVEKSFLALAQQALSANEQRFLTLANATFETHKTAAAGGVKEVVGPVAEQFKQLSETIAALDKARTEDKSALFEQMRQVSETLTQTQTATGKLVNALRVGPKARGRWGEETLRNVLELSGLSAHIDFTQQSSHDGEGGKLRPDVIIRLPGGRCIVVDSKVALSGYLDAMEATDDVARDAFLKKHAHEMRQHMRQLASKEYAKAVPETADFVVMFVPGDNFLSAAFEHDPDLMRESFDERVIIVGPSSLLALAKSISYGWRQEEVAKNAEHIAKLGAEIYGRLDTVADKLGKLGNAMKGSVNAYNDLVGSVERRVLPAARRFREFGIGAGDPEIAVVEPIDAAPRQLTLEIDDAAAAKTKKRSV
ncbi:MAG: DNA recombination protein RmuC [Hyphomonadaceae bacterium]|nr:DNA recombination protein RmuC [Hyphomonadaceae bacterium]